MSKEEENSVEAAKSLIASDTNQDLTSQTQIF